MARSQERGDAPPPTRSRQQTGTPGEILRVPETLQGKPPLVNPEVVSRSATASPGGQPDSRNPVKLNSNLLVHATSHIDRHVIDPAIIVRVLWKPEGVGMCGMTERPVLTVTSRDLPWCEGKPLPRFLVEIPAEPGHHRCPHHFADLHGVFDSGSGASRDKIASDDGQYRRGAGSPVGASGPRDHAGIGALVAGVDCLVGCGRLIPLAILKIGGVHAERIYQAGRERINASFRDKRSREPASQRLFRERLLRRRTYSVRFLVDQPLAFGLVRRDGARYQHPARFAREAEFGRSAIRLALGFCHDAAFCPAFGATQVSHPRGEVLREIQQMRREGYVLPDDLDFRSVRQVQEGVEDQGLRL